MFQFRAFPPYGYLIHRTVLRYSLSGFPHSEIPGSQLICSSPRLIAACRVLLRLLMPRHSPCALISLTFVRRASAELRLPDFWFSELCRSQKFFARIVVCYPFHNRLLHALSRAPLLPCFFSFVHCSVFKVQTPIKDRIKTFKACALSVLIHSPDRWWR